VPLSGFISATVWAGDITAQVLLPAQTVSYLERYATFEKKVFTKNL